MNKRSAARLGNTHAIASFIAVFKKCGQRSKGKMREFQESKVFIAGIQIIILRKEWQDQCPAASSLGFDTRVIR